MEGAETSLEQAKAAWHGALKLRKHLTKQIDKLRANSASGTDIAQFDVVEGALGQFRLACVTTIFLDVEYANKEDSESILWQQHVTINAEFRRILGKLRQDSRVVEKRKVETKYGHFLRVAQQFYEGFIKRLALRYDVPELRRIANSVEPGQNPSSDLISPVAPEMAARVLASCHATLIRLGDLSRYRVQAKHKKSYETALAFYGLAHDVMPHSGFGFHQMGIVSLDEGNHLDVVYHFYRSWAVRDPHPLARQNLESKFKSLANGNGGGGGGHSSRSQAKASSPSPNDAFVMWFCRLHALFYKGEPVSAQQNELEREVFHRMSMAIKDPASAPILFKMGLVNISAHCIALSKKQGKLAEPKTGSGGGGKGGKQSSPSSKSKMVAKRGADAKPADAAARFYQYVLHFNVRFILKLLEAVKADIEDAETSLEEPTAASATPSESSAAATSPTPSVKDALLPLLRVYGIWIASHTAEIFASPDSPSNVVPPMTQALAGVLTSFCNDISNNADTAATCPYLLPEDIEIRGLTFLSDDSVPAACRGYCDDGGNMKPHPDSDSERFEASRESTARVLDILRCAYFIAEDSSVPLSCEPTQFGLEFVYRDPSQSSRAFAEPEPLAARTPERVPAAAHRSPAGPSMSRDSSQRAATQMNAAAAQHRQKQAVHPYADNSTQSAMRAVEDHRPRELPQPQQTVQQQQLPPQVQRQQSTPRAQQQQHLRAPMMDDADETVVNMLSPFLDCPSPKSEHQSPKEPSYGMHSTTANELAQELLKTFQPERDEPAPYYESMNPQAYGSSASASGWNGMFMPPSKPAQQQLPRSPQPAPMSYGQAQARVGGYDGSSPSSSAMQHGGSPYSMTRAASLQQSEALLQQQQQQQQQQSYYDSWSPSYQLPSRNLQSQQQQQQQRPQGMGIMQQPMSSNASLFSHPSSLYQGTPAASGYGAAAFGGYPRAQASAGQYHQGTASPSASSGWYSMDGQTNYDAAAIFQAALNGKR